MSEYETANNVSRDVSYRHLSIPISGDDAIEGFALWYNTEQDARIGFSKFHRYISAPGSTKRYLDVTFKRELAAYRLEILVGIEDEIYLISINGIDVKYIEKLKKSLQSYQYFFLTAGYTDNQGNDVLLPIHEFNYFRNALRIDDKIILGNKVKRWPKEIFEKKTTQQIINK